MTREPGSPMTKSHQQLVDEANAKIVTRNCEQVAELMDSPDHLIVDIRDPRELARDGTIPGAYRAPRGMLEFWVDPASPYYKPALDDGRALVLFCGGGMRSALAAAVLTEMGRDDVSHLAGGYAAWREAGLPTEEYPKK